MSNQEIASVVSEDAPLEGQAHRSSPDFQFSAVPESGNISVVMPDGITATLMHEKGAWPDENVAAIANGTAFDADKVETGANYYIADPSGASGNFIVTFNGNV